MSSNGKSGGKKWVFILVTLVVLVGGGWWFLKSRGNGEVQFQTVAVTRGDITQAVTATGTLNPVLNIQVGSQISGRISKLYADFNSNVTSNQVIAEIDPLTYKANVQRAEADLANAVAAMELARLEARRAAQLFTNSLVSGSDYDTSVAGLHQAEANTKIKQAALDSALVDLSRCTIYSPVDGTVISRNVDVGQTVAASLSAPVLFQIANDLTKMQIDANVSEADVGGVEVGQDAEFIVDAFPFRTFSGAVIQVRNSPSNMQNVVTYATIIEVDNQDLKLKPGMTANVTIVLEHHENVLKVPNSALRFRPPDEFMPESPAPASNAAPVVAQGSTRQGGGEGRRRGGGRGGGGSGGRRTERQPTRTVYVLPAGAPTLGHSGDIQFKAVQVRVGVTDGVSTEILEGLKEGDVVAIGYNALASGGQSAASNPFGGGGGRPGGFRRF